MASVSASVKGRNRRRAVSRVGVGKDMGCHAAARPAGESRGGLVRNLSRQNVGVGIEPSVDIADMTDLARSAELGDDEELPFLTVSRLGVEAKDGRESMP